MDTTINPAPFYIAILTGVYELFSPLPWPISGAFSAAVASTGYLIFTGQLFIHNELKMTVKIH